VRIVAVMQMTLTGALNGGGCWKQSMRDGWAGNNKQRFFLGFDSKEKGEGPNICENYGLDPAEGDYLL
jgi:hypothetical protein